LVATSVLTIAVVAISVAACGSSGRELRDPEPGATAPQRRESSTGTLTPTSGPDTSVFGLASDAWTPGGDIPERYTCDGEDVSPPFAVFSPPPEAVELALVMTDVDTPFVHWVTAGIAPETASFQAGEVPPGAVQAVNSGGSAQYLGPCPPNGEQHTYEFALYALPAPSGVTEGQDAPSAIAAITASPLQTASITGQFER
jgi:Raf kinase inhibitor-like YbhB/YbcL family protein